VPEKREKEKMFYRRLLEEAECYADGAPLNIVNLLFLTLFDGAFQLNLLFRLSKKLQKRFKDVGVLWLIPRIVVYIERIVTGSYIDPEATIGKRLKIIYGMGIVIGAKVRVGDDAIIFNGVSLGSIFPGLPDIRQPQIGSNVFIGTGAKVLGGIKIEDNVKIGANAVVINSFGPSVTVAGVPARIVKSNINKIVAG